jgi:threonine dehydratase
MQGQATVGLEFEEQVPALTLLVAVGGGGLISGIAACMRGACR